MRFSSSFLDELKIRLSVSSVVGRKVKLNRKGDRHWGLCPFHNEKTPSFSVVEDKDFYHCFGCGAHGSSIDFVMETEGLNFPEAVERLAGEVGMEIPLATPEDMVAEETRKSLHDVVEAAAGWFESQLSSVGGEGARRYIETRGLKPATVAKFRIGFAPNRRTALKEAMLARKFTEDQLVESGMLIRPDEGGETYDRFRDRLMFPILDGRGRVMAFGGRALGDARAKYMNSPETPLFHKGFELYNLSHARKPAFDAGTIIVAEGYMDVIALDEGGFTHAVAPLGTALTEDQLRKLWRVAPEPILCFDGDQAGMKAAERAAERALPLLQAGYSLRFAMMPDGEDPDTLIRGEGVAAVTHILDHAMSLADLVWRMLTEGHDLTTPERRAGLKKRVFEQLRSITDKTIADFYQKEFLARLDDIFDTRKPAAGRARKSYGGKADFKGRGPFQARGSFRSSGRLGQTHLGRAQGTGPVTTPMEEILTIGVLNHPEMLVTHLEDFAAIHMSGPELDRLHRAILERVSCTDTLDAADLQHHLRENGFEQILKKLLEHDKHRSVWYVWPQAALSDAEMNWTHVLNRLRRIVVLETEYKQAEDEFASAMTEETRDRFFAVQKARNEALGNEAGLEGLGLASGREVID